jgi:DNA-binding NtrC family response regulator
MTNRSFSPYIRQIQKNMSIAYRESPYYVSSLYQLKSYLMGVMVQAHSYPKICYKLIEIDYQIIKQLVQNPRIEISEIAQIISTSVKTIHRRIQKILRN